MACGGAAALGCALLRRKGFRAVGPAMTLGGIWAIVPDLPRMFRWYPSIPGSNNLGDVSLESLLLSDIFFFHKSLDAQPEEYTLLGFAIVIGLYNLVIFTPLAVDCWKSKRITSMRQRLLRTMMFRGD